MKRYIRTDENPRMEEVRAELVVPKTRHRYIVTGKLDEYAGMFFGQISRIAPYDDADYWWARINGGGLIEFIHDGKVQDTLEFKDFDEEAYETVREYMDEMADTAVRKLDEKNESIKPVMMYD